MLAKYGNMHTNEMFYALNCISIHVIMHIGWMLLEEIDCVRE